MIDRHDSPNEYQLRLIQLLHQKLIIESTQPQIKEGFSNIRIIHSGRGTLEDHLRIMKNYICSCGNKIDGVDYSTSAKTNGTTIDTYKLKCSNCGYHNSVSFVSLRRSLQNKEEKNFTKDKKKFPYL